MGVGEDIVVCWEGMYDVRLCSQVMCGVKLKCVMYGQCVFSGGIIWYKIVL